MNPWTPLVGATFGWSASAVLTRALTVRGVNGWTIIPVRMVFALLSLLLIVAATGRFWHTDARAWRRGLVLGTVGMAFPMTLMTLALEDLPVSLGGLLIALIPLATIGAAHFLVEDERFQIKSLPGLLVALAGSAVLVGFGSGTIEGVGSLWRGVALIASGVVLAGLGGALSRRYALEVASERLVLPQFVVNTLVVTVLFPLLVDFEIGSIDGLGWLLLIGVGTIGTTLAFASFLIAAGLNPASRLALTGYSVPVGAVILAVIFLGETVTLTVAAGAALIILGVVMAETATDTHVPEPGVATAG